MVSDAVLGTVVSVGLSRVCIDRIVAEQIILAHRDAARAKGALVGRYAKERKRIGAVSILVLDKIAAHLIQLRA